MSAHVRMRAAIVVAVALAAAALMTGGCGQSKAPGAGAEQAGAAPDTGGAATFPVSITDDAGRRVTIASRPERIVSLTPATTEIVYALGADVRLVGVTTFCDYPTDAKSKPKVGDFANPNLEAIAGARPDIVLVTGGVQADVIAKLENLGESVVTIDPQTLSGVMAAIETAGRVLGEREAAASVVGEMRSSLADVATRVGREKPVTAFIEVGYDPLFTAGKGTLIDDMITAAGGTNVVKASGWAAYSVEQLVRDQPHTYLGTVSSIGDPEGLEARPGYAKLTAIEQGRIFPLDDNAVSRPGPRVIDGVRMMADALHPDVFEQ
jgi:iron complex transport system substrate-binding protein